jgi:Uma2 family endonuclease
MHMATAIKRWTLDEVHSLPDDGNKYELIYGELFVTPPPTDNHETISARLTRLLDPFVAAHDLGFVYRPRAVVRVSGSEVEPDLMVRQGQPREAASWDNAPLPILVVEIFSGSTRRRDQNQKRGFYTDIGIPEYWMVDPERRVVTVVRPGHPDEEARDILRWQPSGVSETLIMEVARLFD